VTIEEATAHAIAGANQERERIRAIMGLVEAKGREAAALQLALTTALSAAEIAPILATIPKTSGVPTEGRSCHSPIGLALETPGGRPAASAAMTPDEVAAAVNKEPAR
jgi:hypothetical protein